MAGIVAGDRSQTWRLHELSAPSVRPTIWREARRVGVFLTDDEVQEIHIDVTLDLARRAKAWSPDGALPWVWARRRVLAAVHAHIGQFHDEVDDLAEPETPEPVERIDDPLPVLRAIGAHDRRVTALLDLLTDASDRDIAIWLAHRLETQTGNRSPAVTVGADHHLTPAAIRKVVQRVNQRLVGGDFDLAS